jgi:hypothetical protein
MRLLLSAILFFSGCAVLKRSPSSINSSDSIFNLINSEKLLQTRYSFELYNLNTLAEKNPVYKEYDIAVADSKKAVDNWVSELHAYVASAKSDVHFKTGMQEKMIPVGDFVRLDQVLGLLSKSSDSSDSVLRRQVEIITAFNQNFKAKEVTGLDSSSVPIEFSESPHSADSDPVADSSFWKNPSERRQNLRPVDISAGDLAKTRCKISDQEPGSDVKISCGPTHFKIQEQTSPRVAVLNSILYRRLGFNAPALVYQPELQLDFEKTAAGKLANLHANLKFQLKNGDELNLQQATQRLFPFCKSQDSKCFSNSSMVDASFESQIDKLKLSEVSLAVDFGDHEFGVWDYDDLDHRYRKEIKALLFVGALTGNNDLRKENNSLIWSGKNFTISHQIQNLNSGFGRLRSGIMNLNAMQWEVLKTKKNAKGVTFFFDGYRPLVKRHAFSEMTVEDAQWAVRQIADISEGEITEALYHSGFSVAETLLAREKLISIQKNLVESLGLGSEFPALASRKIDRFLNYRIHRQIQSFDLTPTRSVHVPENNDELYNGILRKKTTGK